MATSQENFVFPVKRLENSLVMLEPFNVEAHADLFVRETRDHLELFQYLPYGPFASKEDFYELYRDRVERSPAVQWYAIFAKASPEDTKGTFAGVVGYLYADATNAMIEIGFITIIPSFQRTFVTSNVVGLLLMYALDFPPHGLGLRRCQWQAHAANQPSRRVATRLGFSFEGIRRFERILPPQKIGNGYDVSQLPEATGSKLGPARDSAMLAHYCDEWPEKRKAVVEAMERKN